MSVASVRETERVIVRTLTEKVGMPITQLSTWIESPYLTMRAVEANSHYEGLASLNLRRVNLTARAHMADHITIVQGQPFGEASRHDRLSLWVHEKLHHELALQVGEEYDLAYSGAVIHAYVAGFWRARDSHDSYWFSDPSVYPENLLIPLSDYEDIVQAAFPERTGFDSWYVILDENALSIRRADACATFLEAVHGALESNLPGIKMDCSPLDPLRRYRQRKQTLQILLTGFGIPAMGLLFYFLSLISVVTVQFQ